MTDKKPPSPSVLRQLIDYDPETGALVWRVRDVSFFTDGERSALGAMNAWNARHAGKPALKAKMSSGYFMGRIFGRKYLAHRVSWAIYSGEWPERQIDHINGNRLDNRIANLRCATNQENSKNRAIGINNTSGTIGVYWSINRSNWFAEIYTNGNKKRIGYFKSKDEAIQARAKANLEYGYHANHGRKP
jgi:hypothetical protein